AGAKDSTKRKTKTLPILTKGEIVNRFGWAYGAQSKIAEILQPILLNDVYCKANMRSLTDSEFNRAEMIKFTVLSNIKPFEEITPELVQSVVGQTSPNDYIFSSALVLK